MNNAFGAAGPKGHARMKWQRTYLIGRLPEADAMLLHDRVSRRHAKLVLDDKGGIYLADLGSRHGTFVHRDSEWRRLEGDFVGREEPIRLGGHQTTPALLLDQIARRGKDRTAGGSSDLAEERDVAILIADVVGYSRMMSQDQSGTLNALKNCRRDVVDPEILGHRGRIFGEAGDAVCAEFREAADAVRAAHAIQSALPNRSFGRAAKRVTMRIGIHAGMVIVNGENLFGSAVNIAARLQTLAQPGGICASALIKERATGTGLSFIDLGEKTLKNIPYPVQVYEVGS